jgi:hypothetical protein
MTRADISRACRRRMREQGRCYCCGQGLGVNGTETMCRPCADRAAAVVRRIYAERRAGGLCVRCAKPRGEDGTTWRCRPCEIVTTGAKARAAR